MIKYGKTGGFSVVEFLVICCVIFILIGTFSIYANKLLHEAQELALKHELAAVRMRLKLFEILYDKKPKSIQEFFEAEKGRLDDQGNLLDPFGNKYIYDLKKHIVISSTPGYENW